MATKMFIIKHLSFLLHLHSLSFLEGSFKFSLIKARLSSCRRLINSYKNDTTLHKLNRFTIFYLCLMSGKRNTCLYLKFKLSFFSFRWNTKFEFHQLHKTHKVDIKSGIYFSYDIKSILVITFVHRVYKVTNLLLYYF